MDRQESSKKVVFMIRTYNFSGVSVDTGLFICHLKSPAGIAVITAKLSAKCIKSISFDVLSGSAPNYFHELQLFLSRLFRFVSGNDDLVTLQDLEDTYHDEQLSF